MNNKNALTIKEIPSDDRPRERLLKFGAQSLSNIELLAILIRTGTKKESALSIATQIMSSRDGIEFIASCTIAELRSTKGIGDAKAAQIKAAVELGKRIRGYRKAPGYKICTPKDAADLVMEDMRFLRQEHLKVIFLNTKNIVTEVEDISIGSLNSSIVHPREIYSEAIRKSSSSIIICHNHPSGDPIESPEDIDVTKRLSEVGRLVGIELIDHIIIGDGIYISMKEKGIL